MILEIEHHNKLIFQLPTDHFDVVHAALREINAVATEEKEAHCECFCIRNGSVGKLFVYCDGRARIFGGTIDWMQVYGQVSLAYYGPGCAEGAIKELHIGQGAYVRTDMKTLQYLMDTGSDIHIAVGAMIWIEDRCYTMKIEQTADTFLGNIKTVEKFTNLMDEKIKAHVNLPEIHVDAVQKDDRIVTDITIENPIKWWNDPIKNVKINPNIEPVEIKEEPLVKPEINSGIKHGPYTVRQLIEQLLKCKNQDAPVFAYLTDEGVRLDMILVDDGFDQHRMVDLNIDDELLWNKSEREQKEEDNNNV